MIDVSLVQGSITVRGTDRKDVMVIAHPEADRPSRKSDPDAAGLRRIPQTADYRISEEANRIKISSDSPNRSVTFEIEVPSRTNLKLHTANGGEILVENIEGDPDFEKDPDDVPDELPDCDECDPDDPADSPDGCVAG